LIKFDLDHFMVDNNVFDSMFFTYFFKHSFNISLPSQYEIILYDQHVNKEVINEKKVLILKSDNYVIEDV